MSEREKLPIERNWAFNNPETRAKSLAIRKANIAAKKQAIADGTWVEPPRAPKKPDKRKRKWTVVEKANTSKKRNQEIRKAKGIEQVLVDAEKLEREMLQEAQKVLGTLPRVSQQVDGAAVPMGAVLASPQPGSNNVHTHPMVATDTQPPVTPSESPHLPALREMVQSLESMDPNGDVFLTAGDWQTILKALLYALGGV